MNVLKPLVFFLASGLLVLAVSFSGCTNGGGGGDDDDGSSFGEAVAGTYDVIATIDVDDCAPQNEGETADWLLDITQSDDLSVAWVKYKEKGAGQDWIDLFKGDVYGTVILKAGIVTNSAGPACTKVSVQNYSVKIDLDSNTLSGRLTEDIFYMGDGCDSSTVDCHLERTLVPNE